jgi:hypothetical protein
VSRTSCEGRQGMAKDKQSACKVFVGLSVF